MDSRMLNWLRRKPQAPKPLILRDSDLVSLPYNCPHKTCRGRLVLLKGELNMLSPNGRVKREGKIQVFCLRCHSHFVGTSAKSISQMKFTQPEISQWKARLAKERISLE